MVADRLLAERRCDPFAGRLGIGHRLDGGEGLGGDDEQRRLGLQTLQRVGDVRAVDIGDEMGARAVVVGRKRQRRHRRAEIGAADADIDDVGDLSCRSAPGALPRRTASAKAAIASSTSCTSGITSWPSTDTPLSARIAQRGVQHGAVLGDVDLVARETSRRGAPRRRRRPPASSNRSIVSAVTAHLDQSSRRSSRASEKSAKRCGSAAKAARMSIGVAARWSRSAAMRALRGCVGHGGNSFDMVRRRDHTRPAAICDAASQHEGAFRADGTVAGQRSLA